MPAGAGVRYNRHRARVAVGQYELARSLNTRGNRGVGPQVLDVRNPSRRSDGAHMSPPFHRRLLPTQGRNTSAGQRATRIDFRSNRETLLRIHVHRRGIVTCTTVHAVGVDAVKGRRKPKRLLAAARNDAPHRADHHGVPTSVAGIRKLKLEGNEIFTFCGKILKDVGMIVLCVEERRTRKR